MKHKAHDVEQDQRTTPTEVKESLVAGSVVGRDAVLQAGPVRGVQTIRAIRGLMDHRFGATL